MLFGQEHVRRYVETGGQEGHEWEGTVALILTTKGRHTGERRSTPLIYQPDGEGFVIVGSKAEADEPPAWYLNLQADPEVEVQVRDEVFTARARTVDAQEKARLWPKMVAVWPQYEDYQRKTDRDIPVVLLERQ